MNDTELHFARQALDAMSVASVVKKPIVRGEQHGAAMDDHASVTMSEVTWLSICPGICWFADVGDMVVTAERRYHDGVGTVQVTFARRRGDD